MPEGAWKQLVQAGTLRLVGVNDEIGGLTFDDAFIIGDEMQNASLGQINRLLGRKGRCANGSDSPVVLIGDPAQLGRKANWQKDVSALEKFADKCARISHGVLVRFTADDVVRSEDGPTNMQIMDELFQEEEAQQPVHKSAGAAALQSVAASAKGR